VSHLNCSADLILQLIPETVWAFVGMRNYKHELIKYLRNKKHYNYVEKSVLELRNDICRQATLYGTVDDRKRKLYLKYNNYLIKLTNGTK